MKQLRNEQQAFQALAKEAGAAQVARMADGTLACSGRDGQLAEPVEYGPSNNDELLRSVTDELYRITQRDNSSSEYTDWLICSARSALAKQAVAQPVEHDDGDRCTNPDGHQWAFTGTAYGGDDERWHGEGRCLCVYCGADGDA